MEKATYRIGLDVGSTTAKIAVIDAADRIVYSNYQRHNARVDELVGKYFDDIRAITGDVPTSICVTGSVGMATAERLGAEFVQEVVAATIYARHCHPEAKALIDIGGEDAKVVFFNGQSMELRMNGNCAGGTGAFIDQMSVLMGKDNQEMSRLAMNATHVYPMAARCGVFAKTDIQNLMSRNLPEEDIAASIFHSIAVQTVVTLSHGMDFQPPILLCGGPLTFLPALRKAFQDYMHLTEADFIVSEDSNLIPALGCAYKASPPARPLDARKARTPLPLSPKGCLPEQEGEGSKMLPDTIINQQETQAASANHSPLLGEGLGVRLHPLFSSPADHAAWLESKKQFAAEIKPFRPGKQQIVIGIDSGSTTTKLVALTLEGDIVFTNYRLNLGNPIGAVSDALKVLYEEASHQHAELEIVGSCSTGYGEELIKAAFNLDCGIIETMAHYHAAASLMPDVSFILDIGGQDMKAIFVDNGAVVRMELNEACSSGCGTFIQTFANNLGYSVADFAQLACESQSPCDLGTRCTVFMNSKVKQVLREGATVADISAGIAYSVVKNCLYKVLKLHGGDSLGDKIVVQGGTMRNDSVVRAFELLTHTEVARSNMPEMMGAYGCALHALEQPHPQPLSRSARRDACQSKKERGVKCCPDTKVNEQQTPTAEASLGGDVSPRRDKQEAQANTANHSPLLGEGPGVRLSTRQLQCHGCENNCYVSRYTFQNGKHFYSGNKCERVFNNKGENDVKGENIYTYKYKLLFGKEERGEQENSSLFTLHSSLTLGLPRALGMYEDYPFWHTLLTEAGCRVVLSSESTFSRYEGALKSVMSDNICFPAKLMHSHIKELNENPEVDRILMPYVVYEHNDDPERTINSFNCPIVSGYSDVIKSAMPLSKPLDAPVINFSNEKLLALQIVDYLKTLGISPTTAELAFQAAIKAQQAYTKAVKKKAQEILEQSRKDGRLTILLAGRPYHTDPLVQHKLSEMIASLGVNVISDDIVREDTVTPSGDTYLVKQWAYMNRIVKSGQWAAEQPSDLHFVEMTSFGCGPDSFIQDEIRDLMKRHGKPFTLLKIDDVSNIGSLKLRVRSLIESLKPHPLTPLQGEGSKMQPDTKVNEQQTPTAETSLGGDVSPRRDKQEAQANTANHSPLLGEGAGVRLPGERLVSTRVFRHEDRCRKILAPFMTEYLTPIISPILRLIGYDVEVLPMSDGESAELGLKYANNEVCYPATLIVGDIIKALKSGKYDLQNTAVAMSQTGGQCRATNYAGLIKRAMVANGFQDVPLITLGVTATAGEGNEQEGFDVPWLKYSQIIVTAILYGDAINEMYNACIVRETQKGIATRLREKYMTLCEEPILRNSAKGLIRLIAQAAEEFDRATETRDVPRVGIVGEIFLKFNPFSHQYIEQYIISKGIEVVPPLLAPFFLQEFVNVEVQKHMRLSCSRVPDFLVRGAYQALVGRRIRQINKAASRFRYFRPFTNIYDDAKEVDGLVSLAAQFGEGWLLPADIVGYIRDGVDNIISLQPFGCIANHVISKGIEKRLHERFPQLNLVSLDFDSGVSEVNVTNRLLLFLNAIAG